MGEFISKLEGDEDDDDEPEDIETEKPGDLSKDDISKTVEEMENKGVKAVTVEKKPTVEMEEERKDEPTPEPEMIKGELKIQVAKGTNIPDRREEGYKTFFLMVKLPGCNKNEFFKSTPIDFYAK